MFVFIFLNKFFFPIMFTVSSSSGLTVRRSSDVALRKVIEDKTKVEMELMAMKSQLKNLEHENKTVKSQVKKKKNTNFDL